MGSKNGVTAVEPVLDLLLQKKVKAGLGIIAARLDSSAAIAYKKYLPAINDKGEKLFEIWNHGFDHSSDNGLLHSQEFKGTTYEFQKRHLLNAQIRVKGLLGVEMHTFGAPFNACDSTTVKMLSENNNYKVFLFSNLKTDAGSQIKSLNNRVNMESTTGGVNFTYFITQYQRSKKWYADYMVLQGHPYMWDSNKVAEFNKILDYLIEQKCEFVLPYDYARKHISLLK